MACTGNLSFSFRGCTHGFQQHGYLVHIVLVKVIAFNGSEEPTISSNMDERTMSSRNATFSFRVLSSARLRSSMSVPVAYQRTRRPAYCYNDARVIKFVWTNLVKNRMKGGARSFED